MDPVSTSFVGDPRRWAEKPSSFTRSVCWINVDASNRNSKVHLSKARAYLRNEYRRSRPGSPSKSSVAPSELSRSTGTSPPTSLSSVSPPFLWPDPEFQSTDVVFDGKSSVTGVETPKRGLGMNNGWAAERSFALLARREPSAILGPTFDTVENSALALKKINDPRKDYEGSNLHDITLSTPVKTADALKPISANAKRSLVRLVRPVQLSKHKSSKPFQDHDQRQKALESYSLRSSIGGLRDDPFISFPIQSSCSVIEAADYWVNTWAPAQTPSYVKAELWTPTISKVFSIAMADEGAFESQIALAQSFLSCNGDNGGEPTKEVLYHQTRAMLSLRKALETGNLSAGALLSSLNLLIMSVVHCDRNAYNFHHRGLERMTKNEPDNPSTALIHGIIKGYLVTTHFYVRLLNFQTRRDSPNNQITNKLIYPRHPFHPTLSAEIATLPSGFCELALELSLPTQVIDMLKITAQWNAVISPKPDDTNSTQDPEIWFPWDSDKAPEILEQLLVSPNSQRAISYPLCMILMLYSINAHKRFQPPKIYGRLVQDAINSIQDLNPTSKAQRECRLWMAVVASGCARDGGSGNPRIETSGLLRDVASSTTRKNWQEQSPKQAMRWDAVETIMKKFFWYEHFAPTWRRCWDFEVENF